MCIARFTRAATQFSSDYSLNIKTQLCIQKPEFHKEVDILQKDKEILTCDC
jgi:hypothetical protein